MSSKKVFIHTDANETVEAVAPEVISASRSTDIPAFYADWFFHRLDKGYCSWKNPFNQKKMYVSFENCKAIVFWSKNPKPILPYLKKLDDRNISYYFQYTINDYEKEKFEPHVPSLIDRVKTCRALYKKVGSDRIIWRFDPLIMVPGMDCNDLVQRVKAVGDKIKGYTNKLVFSFVDVRNYKKVQRNLIKETEYYTDFSIYDAEPGERDKKCIAEKLAQVRDEWNHDGWRISLATCCEGIELDALGIQHNKCVDGELIEKILAGKRRWPVTMVDGNLFGEAPVALPKSLYGASLSRYKKDKGQRDGCGCVESKDIGSYNTCRHFCVYCYANTSRTCVDRTVENISHSGESLVEAR